MRIPATVAVLLLPFFTVPCAAQTEGYKDHWGVSASFVPRWRVPSQLADLWDIETDMRGSEVRAGIVRGRDVGGEWGVSFVKKTVDEGSTVQLRRSACVQLPSGSPQCARGAYDITRDAGMTGVEAHLFIELATIRRVGIGVAFAGGIARLDGTSDRFLEHLVVNGSAVTAVTESLGIEPFKETLQGFPESWRVVPIGRVELGVGVLVRPGVKLRATSGVNFPGYHRIGMHIQYLLGAK